MVAFFLVQQSPEPCVPLGTYLGAYLWLSRFPVSSILPPLTALPTGCFCLHTHLCFHRETADPQTQESIRLALSALETFLIPGPSRGSASWNGLQSYSVGSGRTLLQLPLTNPSTVFYGLPKGWKVNKTEESALLLSWMSVWTRVARPAISWHTLLKATAPPILPLLKPMPLNSLQPADQPITLAISITLRPATDRLFSPQ